MALDAEKVARIHQGGPWTTRVDLQAAGVWCEITRPFPLGTINQGGGSGDPGYARLLAEPVIVRTIEKDTGRVATEPVTLSVRNDDGWWCRTKGVYLLDDTGTARFLRALKLARVRLRAVDGRGGNEEVLGFWYIERIATAGAEARLTLQPLERLFASVSPAEIRQGDSWYRNVEPGIIVRRVVEHVLPGVVWESGSPPDRVVKTLRPDFLPATSNPRIGTVLDQLGRQPEKTAGVLTFGADSTIPTAIAESASDSDRLYYAVFDVRGKATRLYRYSRATGNSTLIYSGETNRPVCMIREISSTLLTFGVVGLRSDQRGNTYGRDSSLYTIIPSSGGGLTLKVQSQGWSGVDSYCPTQGHDDGTDSIGTVHDVYGWEDGEMLCIGFPQCVFGHRATTDIRLNNSLRSLKNAWTVGNLAGDYATLRRVYNHSGWTFVQHTDPLEAWYHLNPFPKPWVWMPSYNYEAQVDWKQANNRWELRLHRWGPDDDVTPAWINYATGNDFKLAQLTGWCAVSQSGSDARLGSTQWLLIATIGYRKNRAGDGGNVHATRLWKLDVAIGPHPTQGYYTGNGSLTQLLASTPADGAAGPFPVLLDFTYCPAYNVLQTSCLIGCYLDTKTKMYGVFKFNLVTNAISYGWGVNAPLSGSPYVAFREVDSGDLSRASNRQVIFRDCGTGALWACDPDGDFWTMGNGRGVGSESDTWEACPSLAVIKGANFLADTRIFGFTAPTSPPWVWQIDAVDGDGAPPTDPRGEFQLWGLGPDLTIRIPVADFRADLIEYCDRLLTYVAQLCGPRWRWGFDTHTGEFYFKENPLSDPAFTLVDPRDRAAWPSELELPALDLEREESPDDDVANDYKIVPYVAEFPPVGVKLDLAPRAEDGQFGVDLKASATVEAARRVTVNVVRDGSVGDLDLGTLTTFNSDWNSNVLLSFRSDAEDLSTELEYDTATYTTLRVRGIGPAPSGMAHERTLYGAVIRAAIPGTSFRGDFIVVGESDTRRIVAFGIVNEIITSGTAIAPGTIPKGTSVRIQQAQGNGLYGTPGSPEDGFVYVNGFGTTGAVFCHAINGEGIHVGDVFQIEQELIRVETMRSGSALGEPYSHRLDVTRGYLGTQPAIHSTGSGPYLCQVFVHPRRSGSYQLGATGLVLSINFDAGADPHTRTFKAGDRILLESPGVRAVPHKYSRGLATGSASIIDHGKRTGKALDRNPLIASALAPHVAWEWLQYTQLARIPLTCSVPYAPEISPNDAAAIVSALRFPDEPSNTVTADLYRLEHDARAGITVMRFRSRNQAEAEASPGGGVGLPGLGLS